MGDVIAFRPGRDATPPKLPPQGTAEVVAFTGRWHARIDKGEYRPAWMTSRWFGYIEHYFARFVGLLRACVEQFPGEQRQTASSTASPSSPYSNLMEGQRAAGFCSQTFLADNQGYRPQAASTPAAPQVQEG